MKRREFLKLGVGAVGGFSLGKLTGCSMKDMSMKNSKLPFKISLAEWSFHRRLFGQQEPKLDHLDFAKVARSYDIEAVEYCNPFFMDKAEDRSYLAEMKKRAEDQGVKSLLIMCDNEGNLGDPDEKKRTQAVKNHYKWVEAAKILGCHSIRVNAHSEGTYDEQCKLAADGLFRLSKFASDYGINVIVENHGGLSSNGKWLTEVMEKVNRLNCGTLPDFGNFHEYDRYQGVTDLMPFAKAVSAKSHDFDEQGNEIHTDYYRMMKIVVEAGYSGYVGIEYEGEQLNEEEGVQATRNLLIKVQKEVS
jgi:sugar phosphate isomerase/epimerase